MTTNVIFSRYKIFFILLFMTLTACQTQEASKESITMPMRYKTKYFSINFPEDWEINREATKVYDSLYSSLSEEYDADMSFMAYMGINRIPTSSFDIPPRIYLALEKPTLPIPSTQDIVLSQLDMTVEAGIEVRLIELKDCNLDGHKGSVAEFEQLLRNGKVLHKLMYCIKRSDGSVMTITTGVDKNGSDSDFELVKEIVRTLKIFDAK